MAKLDRLGWAAGLAFVSHGVRIGIRVNDPAVLDRLTTCLPTGAEPAESPIVDDLYSVRVGGAQPGTHLRHYHLLYWGSGRLARAMDLDEVFRTLASSLHFSVALGSRPWLFVHAGVVGWRGRAIVLPGRTMTGKTTLVAALVKAGTTYYSDEYAVFDERGLVHPYPKPLTLRSADGNGKHECTAAELRGTVGTTPLPVGLVVATAYHSNGRWRPRTLSAGQAALALFDNTVVARLRPEAALTTFKHALRGAIALRGARGEAGDVVGALLDRVATSTGADPASRSGSVFRARGRRAQDSAEEPWDEE